MVKKMLKGGSLSPDTIQALLKKSYDKKLSSFQDFEIDKSLSGQRVQVYYNPALKQAVVVHRGSSGAKDWLVNDAGLLVGYRGKRFSHAQDIQKQAQQKYGASNVTTIGHSLGAKIAEEVGQKSKEVITLNKPTVSTKKVSGKQYDIRTAKDLVSILSPIAKNKNLITIPSGNKNPVSEHSTDVLSRLPKAKKIGRGMNGGVAPLSAVEQRTRIKNHIQAQLLEISNIPDTNKLPRLQALREYAYANQAQQRRLFLGREITIIEDEIRRITGGVIGFGVGMKGGATNAEVAVTFQEFTDRYAQIRRIPSPTLRHERLWELLEDGSGIADQLTPEQAAPFNNLINGTYTREFRRIGNEIDELNRIQEAEGNKENEKPSNRRGGKRAVTPPPSNLYSLSDEDIADIRRARQLAAQAAAAAAAQQVIENAEIAAEMAAWGVPLWNQPTVQPRAIRPRNIGAPRGGMVQEQAPPVITIEQMRQYILNRYNGIMEHPDWAGRRNNLYHLMNEVAEDYNPQYGNAFDDEVDIIFDTIQALQEGDQASDDGLTDFESSDEEGEILAIQNPDDMEGGGTGSSVYSDNPELRDEYSRLLESTRALSLQVANARLQLANRQDQSRQYEIDIAQLRALRDRLRDLIRNLITIRNSGTDISAPTEMYNNMLEEYIDLRTELGRNNDDEFPSNFGGGPRSSRQVAPAEYNISAVTPAPAPLYDENPIINYWMRKSPAEREKGLFDSKRRLLRLAPKLRYYQAGGDDSVIPRLQIERDDARKELKRIRLDTSISDAKRKALMEVQREKYNEINEYLNFSRREKSDLHEDINRSLTSEEGIVAVNQKIENANNNILAIEEINRRLGTDTTASGGIRYKYNPETDQYTRRNWLSRTKADTDIKVKQSQIDDLYIQLYHHPSRREEILYHFANDNGYTDDQLDYILSVIDNDENRKHTYIQTERRGAAIQPVVAIEYIDNPIGSHSRFRGDNISDLPLARQVPVEYGFIPEPEYEGTNPFQNPDELGELIPQTGAGRSDCYNECSECGCDSYRDFNALHAM